MKDIVNEILQSGLPVEEQLRQMADFAKSIDTALGVVFRSKRKWAWLLGPETAIDLEIKGPFGEAEANAFVGYSIALRRAIAPVPNSPIEPAQQEETHEKD